MSETTRKKKIPKSLAGTRLDKVLPALWPDLSRRQGRRAIAEGRVRVGGVALKVASRAVRAVGFVEIEEAGTDLPEPPDLQVPVLFEDKDVVVLDKPPGVAVQPGRSADLPDLLRWWSHGHEGEILKVVHRLDVPASGLVVLARTRASAAAPCSRSSSTASRHPDHTACPITLSPSYCASADAPCSSRVFNTASPPGLSSQ